MVEPNFPHKDNDVSMPERAREAFLAHAENALGDKPRKAREEIERVYERDADAVISVSGGKDSMTALALADASDAKHRALHWDYGPEFIPRELAREVLDNILENADTSRFFVSNEAMSFFREYRNATKFREQLDTQKRLSDEPSIRDTREGKNLKRMRKRLYASYRDGLFSRQVLGTRRGENSDRAEYAQELYGKSLGLPAAFPIREWSARDVWAYLVDRGVSYPSYYDKMADTPEEYENARMGAVFRTHRNVGVDGTSKHGIGYWDERGLEHLR